MPKYISFLYVFALIKKYNSQKIPAIFHLALLLAFSTQLFAQKAHKAIFIIADGIPADVIEKLPTPALDEISRQGGYTRAYVGGEKGGYSQTPTISAVGYNSLLTGTWVNKHNVWNNDIKSPNYAYWNIFRLLKNQYPQKKTAVFSTWLDNRTKLVGSKVKEADNLEPDFHVDGLELDTVKYTHDTAGYFYHLIDEAVTDSTVSNIKEKAPDLTWVYLEYTDEMGHRHGNSKYLDNAVLMLDKQVHRIWQAIQYRQQNFKEDWELYITTDHGRDSIGYNHGGQSPRERTTWIVTNAKGLNKRFTKEQPAIVDIMPSLARFLQINIPHEQLMEVDGIPLTGKISATNARAILIKDKIRVSWKAIDRRGKAKIWLATTNSFKTGGRDKYQLVATIPVGAQKAIVDVKNTPSSFYKIVIEMPFNMLNRWIVINKK
ncbi:alkaline phosphatase family protein [Flavisolibacter ginsengisoli]|jgi:predicted AlkP superfamily pyrophosphatase or phosphodiesterase|uniref:Type I phosphodiesterase / nucleotide pyrophosphatase n=1 Tax=Flavisolibacter ginsengisoli DSM 18119 TaxID=1121884 RepID=A0A1M5AGD4_9BACT|nr:alkaline phosphatase family protein [Flavisolibacter ginsengisoli]SHF29204.1 Type I phosphodiesterase / nucleotide pyrophosphatase [Flavisolibacter ginsengisoli DSM 18119]